MIDKKTLKVFFFFFFFPLKKMPKYIFGKTFKIKFLLKTLFNFKIYISQHNFKIL
jgi:hypothetical protein